MNDEGVRGLVICHSALADGMVNAARQISGAPDTALQPLTNEGRGPEGLVEAVRAAAGDAPVVLFIDLASGSCAFAARKVAHDRPGTAVVFGVNLPVLLDFVFHRDLPLEQLVPRLVDKGRAGISGSCIHPVAHADPASTG
jgi:mannose/fructose-specific phosphotransferase system component IIA